MSHMDGVQNGLITVTYATPCAVTLASASVGRGAEVIQEAVRLVLDDELCRG